MINFFILIRFYCFCDIFRTYVNIVPVPSVKTVVMAKQKPNNCQFLHHGECACWIGHLYNQSQKKDFYDKMQQEMHKIDEKVALMKEFSNLDEFAVVFQPWSLGLSVSYSSFSVFSTSLRC